MSHCNSPMDDSSSNNSAGNNTNNNNSDLNNSLMNSTNNAALSAATLSALIPQPTGVLSSHTLANIHVKILQNYIFSNE